jgi:hypothetical protein
VLWFRVPVTTPAIVYPTPFCLRNWDRIEQLTPVRPGSAQYERELFFGPTPINPPGTPCGTAAQWMGQIDYDTWIAGGYSCNCPGNIMAAFVMDIYSPLNTLTISPHNGHVLADINLANPNIWTAQQTFGNGLVSTNSAFQVTNRAALNLDLLINQTTGATPIVDWQYHLNFQDPFTGILWVGAMELAIDTATPIMQLTLGCTAAGANKDVEIVLYDATGTQRVGASGTIGVGATVYGGIVVGLGSAFTLAFPVTVSGIADGCVPYVGSDGELESAMGDDFLFDYDGSLGPNHTVGTLYIGAVNQGGQQGAIALWDVTAGAWQPLSFDNGFLDLFAGIKASGAVTFSAGLTVTLGLNTDTLTTSSNATVGLNLAVTGTSTLTGNVSCGGTVTIATSLSAPIVTVTTNQGMVFTSQTNGASTHAGTLTNAPAVGNPTFWLEVLINGTPRKIPCW